MARFGTYPTTYEERKSITIAELKKWDYLVPGHYKTGTLNWSRNGLANGSITIATYLGKEAPYLKLSYTLNSEKDIEYKVTLVTMTSNLGKGQVWYFQCPFTCKLCRKLYLIDGYFQHREATKGYYEKQIQTKQYREIEKIYGPYFQQEQWFDKLHGKYFKKYYKGKPTKRYLRIIKKLEAAKGVNEEALFNKLSSRRG